MLFSTWFFLQFIIEYKHFLLFSYIDLLFETIDTILYESDSSFPIFRKILKSLQGNRWWYSFEYIKSNIGIATKSALYKRYSGT